MAKIRVFLADDHAVLRSGLRLLINTQSDMEVVGETGDHGSLVAKVRECRPDVVTLDLSMPGGSAAQVIEQLARDVPTVRVLVLTMHDDPTYFRIAMAAGACGYLVKKAADSDLLTAIRSVARGRVFTQIDFPATAGPPPFAKPPPAVGTIVPAKSPLATLSDREREVLVLVALGNTNQAIADRLGLSVKTVESYRARLMDKLGLKNRAELTQFAVQAGLLHASPPAAE